MGNSYSCNGNPSETVCVDLNIAHTQYNVQTATSPLCGGVTTDAVTTSPNANYAGRGYFCAVVSQCGTIGQSNWIEGQY